MDAQMDALKEQMEEQQVLADQIEKDTGVPYITAFVMAGDQLSGQRALAKVQAGEWDAERGLLLTGSYARLPLALTMTDLGLLDEDALFRDLPDLWRGSDPDDTDARYLNLWQVARDKNGGAVVDGSPLPKANPLMVYRGQMPNDPVGIAWTTDKSIAEKFAGGAGLRTPIAGGVILRGLVDPAKVLAYLTLRGESEVIVDPTDVSIRPKCETCWYPAAEGGTYCAGHERLFDYDPTREIAANE